MPAITGLHATLVAIGFLSSVALYSRIPEPYCEPGCTMVLARPMIAFVLPAALAVVVVLLGLLWKRDPIRDRDAHMEATYSAIVSAVLFLILGVHLAVLFALTSQLQVNVVRVVAHGVPLMLGLTLVVIGNLLPRLRPNLVIGIRTRRTLSDRSAWARANRTAGYATVVAGSSLLIAGMLPSLPVMAFATIAALGIITMLAWTSWRARHA